MNWIKRYLIFVLTSVISVFLLCAYFMATNGGYDFSGQLIGRDFLNTHTGGLLISGGRWEVLYQAEEYWAEIKALHGPDYPIHSWSYPPLLWPLSQLLSHFSYFAAYTVWCILGLAMVFAAVRTLGLSWYWGVFIYLSPAGLLNFLAGQNGFILSSLMMMALGLTLRRKAVAAGLGWAILAVKPHLGVCVVPMLVGQGQIKTMIWGAVFLGLAISFTLFAYGVEPWVLFFDVTSKQQVFVIENWKGAIEWMVPSGFMQGRNLDLPLSSSYLLHVLIALAAVLLLVLCWPGKDGHLHDWALWLVTGTLVILPYSFVYDFVMLQFAVALWFESGRGIFPERLRQREMPMIAVAWTLAWLAPLVAALFKLQLAPIILLFILYQMARSKSERRGATEAEI